MNRQKKRMGSKIEVAILIFVLLLGTILVLIHNSNNSKSNSNTTNNSSIANIPATSVVNSSNKTISYYNNYFDITLMLPPGWTSTISKSAIMKVLNLESIA